MHDFALATSVQCIPALLLKFCLGRIKPNSTSPRLYRYEGHSELAAPINVESGFLIPGSVANWNNVRPAARGVIEDQDQDDAESARVSKLWPS